MNDYITEVKKAMENGYYHAALALTITLPDICAQVENNIQKSDRTYYINWVNSHLEDENFQFPVTGFETQTFTEEMCYSLRCKVLHNGNTDVINPKLKVLVDSLV